MTSMISLTAGQRRFIFQLKSTCCNDKTVRVFTTMTSSELKLVSNDAIILLTINDVVARWLVDTLLSGRFERFNEHKVHLFTPFNFQATPESLGHNYKVINVFKFLII